MNANDPFSIRTIMSSKKNEEVSGALANQMNELQRRK
jgi:hypothetical protein